MNHIALKILTYNTVPTAHYTLTLQTTQYTLQTHNKLDTKYYTLHNTKYIMHTTHYTLQNIYKIYTT